MTVRRHYPNSLNFMSPSILFFGTERFGKAMLEALHASGAYTIVGVVTATDKPVGRNQVMEESSVKKFATENNIPIFQPEKLKNYNFSIPRPDVSIVCEYGYIIPQAILDFATHGTLNVHTSLLPKYRGASPIQSALVNGETETGVTLMQMDAKMDHGAILAQKKVTIEPNDTAELLADKMKPVAATLLLEQLPHYLSGKLKGTAQNEADVTLCKILSRDDGKINWQRSATEIYNQFRGLTPWPGVWTTWNGKRLKILNMHPVSNHLEPCKVAATKNTITVGTKNGAITITSLQLEGKKPADAAAFLAGNKIEGAILE